eukprot:Phypoly_transcript_07983.p1 GENE.Phypoly_transcript_07983~~Phypoly_transcript_07983.p1  ORF type:complete len:500 (+),score=82.21 Phypoly_transcript_07983:190-1500(+)
MDRLKVLQDIDAARTRGLRDDDYQNRLHSTVSKYLPLRNEEDVKKDVVSHFVLRLAYCRNQTDREWLVTQEKWLLKFRLESVNLSEFLAENNLNFENISREEFTHHESALRATIQSYMPANAPLPPMSADVYYKVPFEKALPLVSARKVFVYKGNAFVHREHLISIVLGFFRAHLSEALVLSFKAYPGLSQTIGPMSTALANLSKRYIGPDYSKVSTTNVQPAQIDELSVKSFPMCMRAMHRKLRTTHHLKHTARMQYGLFLKGIGLNLENALLFWKSEFSRGVGPDVFEKTYAYNIRHNYGKEGKRESYTPYACLKIIDAIPAPGEVHGCPYRQNVDALTKDLQTFGCLSDGNINQVVSLAREGHFQLACARHFELLHPGATLLKLNHPNQYFVESQRYYAKTAIQKGGDTPMDDSSSPVSLPADAQSDTAGASA